MNTVMENQREMILRYMKETGSITPAEAMSEFGCYRLGARIWDLRHAGHSIKRDMVSRKNRYGRIVSFARYSLEDENNEQSV